MVRKIAIVTGTRAEYGLLKPVIGRFFDNPEIELIIFATGMHLSPEFGMTVNEIESDGFQVHERIEILLSSDSPVGVGKSMGLAMMGFTEALARNRPEVVIVLGDRYEVFAAVAAATVVNVPVVHIHGGELTLGAMDDAFRHSITKMSCLHFAATEEYRRRIIQMGESPRNVMNVGSLGVEAVLSLELWSRERLEENLGIRFSETNFLVTFHPATLDPDPVDRQLKQLFRALDQFPHAMIVFTKANADMRGREINALIDGYASRRGSSAAVFASLGQERYLSMMRQCDAVIGNSSSGIIEAPSLHVPTVNIGRRQEGRARSRSVIDCGVEEEMISDAIRKALSPEFKALCLCEKNPYEKDNVANAICQTILERLSSLDVCERLTKEAFFDQYR